MYRTSFATPRWMLFWLALTAAVAGPLGAQAPAATDLPSVRAVPDRPVQGTLFVVEVRDAGAPIGGSFAGETLHFGEVAEGVHRALAAVPIDAEGEMDVAVHPATAAESIRVAVPIARGEYRMERLTVAPRFGSPPDAATAARIAAEAERARDVSRRSHDGARIWGGEIARPRPGRITSGYGSGREFNGRVQSRHMGTDFAGAVGAPIMAPARGVVALVDTFHLGGNVVYIDHGAGLVSGYLHLSHADVRAGEMVEAGQVIGAVGATGRVTGPHLHWLVRYGTITVDPMSLFAAAEALQAPTTAR
jgi:murein DD-endopeptidase MepM/ murein hydrolase activator NlpD